MSKKNDFYAQSGGVTAVINASACGLLIRFNKPDVNSKNLANRSPAKNMLVIN